MAWKITKLSYDSGREHASLIMLNTPGNALNLEFKVHIEGDATESAVNEAVKVAAKAVLRDAADNL
ncbi:hypothetical protein [Phreatobacter sp.]|uniref:hypothetical protein n=1 Tax=Phreatobacter sp. TaxID=1966341 RepID=UPI003F6FE099